MLNLEVIGAFLVVWGIILTWMAGHLIPSGSILVVRRLRTFVRAVKPHKRIEWTNPLLESAELVSTRVHEDEFPPTKETEAIVDGKLIKRAVYRIPQKEAKGALYYIPQEKGNLDGDWDVVDYEAYIEHKVPESLKQSGKEAEKAEWIKRFKAVLDDEEMQAGLTTEVPFVVEWYVDTDSIKDYIENTGHTRQVVKRLDDAIADLLATFLGPTTAEHVATEAKVYIDREILRRLRQEVGQKKDEKGNPIVSLTARPMGININRAYMKLLDPGHTVNLARAKAGASIALKKETKNQALAQAQSIEILSKANAKADIRKGTGEAGRLGKVLEKYNENPRAIEFIMQNEAARDILPKSKLIIAPSDTGAYANIFALGSAATAVMNEKDTDEKEGGAGTPSSPTPPAPQPPKQAAPQPKPQGKSPQGQGNRNRGRNR